MVTVGLWVRLEAKPGCERDLEAFLRNAEPLVQQESATLAWFGVRLSSTTFGIFDAFADQAGRNAHLAGQVAAALGEQAAALLATAPIIEEVDVLAAKLSR